MKEARLVHLLQAGEQRRQDAVDRRRIEGPLLLDPLLECLAVEQLHDDVGGAHDLEEVEDAHDAGRVVQAGQRAAFGHEALTAPGEVLGDLGRARQHGVATLADGDGGRQVFLDRHFAAKLGVVCAVGDAEAALAENGNHRVAADGLAGLQRDKIDLGRVRCARIDNLARHAVIHENFPRLPAARRTPSPASTKAFRAARCQCVI